MMYASLRTPFDFFKGNHTYHRISLWLCLEGEKEVVENESAITVSMIELLQRAQDEKLLEKDFSPLFYWQGQ